MPNAGVICFVLFAAATLLMVEAEEDKRATWLETREMEDNFKDHVYLSLQQLVREGHVNPETISSDASEAVDKRGRQQGFCFRKTRTGRYLPYICWKKAQATKTESSDSSA